MIRYPVKAAVRATNQDSPLGTGPEIGVFDSFGYWVQFPAGLLRFDPSQIDLANAIASAVNQAFEDGRTEARAEMRRALGLED